MGDGGAPVSLHVRRMTPPRFFCSIRLEINDSTVTTVIINQMAVARGAQVRKFSKIAFETPVFLSFDCYAYSSIESR